MRGTSSSWHCNVSKRLIASEIGLIKHNGQARFAPVRGLTECNERLRNDSRSGQSHAAQLEHRRRTRARCRQSSRDCGRPRLIWAMRPSRLRKGTMCTSTALLQTLFDGQFKKTNPPCKRSNVVQNGSTITEQHECKFSDDKPVKSTVIDDGGRRHGGAYRSAAGRQERQDRKRQQIRRGPAPPACSSATMSEKTARNSTSCILLRMPKQPAKAP